VGAGLDSQSGQPSNAVANDQTDSSAYDASDAPAPPGDALLASDTPSEEASLHANADAWADAGANANTNAVADADTDAGAHTDAQAVTDAHALADAAGDAEAPGDAGTSNAADAGVNGVSDSMGDEASADGPSDADAAVDAAGAAVDADDGAARDALPEAVLDAEPDADAAADAACSAPHVSVLTPASAATITVSNGNRSTYFFTFSAQVDFCAAMQSVTFDYSGPMGRVSAQERIFTSPASPFTERTQVGGAGNSLAAYDGGQNPSSWIFVVTAVDANNQITVVEVPFTLMVGSSN
jgi:hypothetical protein